MAIMLMMTPFQPNKRMGDDLDGIGDNADTDDDNDGYSDIIETNFGSSSTDATNFQLWIFQIQLMN